MRSPSRKSNGNVSEFSFATAIGPLTILTSEAGLREVRLPTARKTANGVATNGAAPKNGGQSGAWARQAVTELKEYFAGKRTEFTVPLDLEGTDFQRKVWRALLEIPYGETRSYGDVAKKIGKPKAARAVGMANHWNPVAIIVPCHRVIASDGSLHGYGGGLEMKSELLLLERGHESGLPTAKARAKEVTKEAAKTKKPGRAQR